MNGEVVVVILAAGAGRRMGGVAKALLETDAGSGESETFLGSIASTAAHAGAGRGVVVVGAPYGERVAAVARQLGLEVVENPDPDRGMSSSVAIGFDHVASRLGGAGAALLWPVDHARVSLATVALLVADSGPDRILVPTWRGRGGHPTGFGRHLWPELAGCADLPRGARSVIERHAGSVLRLEVDDPGVTADVDHPDDLG
ncbi:MAG TPA: nucleotidyltransferase family protein [Kofleriaceae bacterium]|nr:nucleotidyltransferase family protein [Kofleriaceae bacterium]